MPAAIPPISPPQITSVTDISITFDAESPQAFVALSYSDGSQQRASVAADSTFLALAAATGSRKQRLYNVILPLIGITPGAIT